MDIIYYQIFKFLDYEQNLYLIYKFPFLKRFINLVKEQKFYKNNNLYLTNNELPKDLIYKENIYFFLKLMNPIYFYVKNFNVVNIIDNKLIIISKNNENVNFFLKLQKIIENSFSKKNYIFDNSILINNHTRQVIIYLNINDSQIINFKYKNNFLIKYTGVYLQRYRYMINNFIYINNF